MWVILKPLLVGIEVLPVSLCVRIAVWTAVSVPRTGTTMIVVVMVMVGSSRLLIYMGIMACMTMMAVPVSSTDMAVAVVVVVVMRLRCFGVDPWGNDADDACARDVRNHGGRGGHDHGEVQQVVQADLGVRGLFFAHLVGLVGGVLARTIGEIWGMISSGSVRGPYVMYSNAEV